MEGNSSRCSNINAPNLRTLRNCFLSVGFILPTLCFSSNPKHLRYILKAGFDAMQQSLSDGAKIQDPPLVFFDLETTGLGQSCEIVQLAAVSGGHSLNLYVVPRCRMDHGAAKVTGFRIRRQRLYLHRQLVLTNSLREVLVSFIAFLRMLGRPLVIGHNIRHFDCPLLARALDELNLRAEFESSISGCVDTLPLSREMLKDRHLQSFRQENLVRELVGVSYKAHDALEDVRALQALYSFLQPSPELAYRHTFTLDTKDNKPAAKAAKGKGSCKPIGQRPLGGNFRKTVKVTEGNEKDSDNGLHNI